MKYNLFQTVKIQCKPAEFNGKKGKIVLCSWDGGYVVRVEMSAQHVVDAFFLETELTTVGV